ncbi:MAG: cupin domain-containing protein [Bacteroidetes bacterium]|nr:cupin domain-containing protein [Bacteroidota bacterium]
MNIREPEQLFFYDDGVVPNSKHPVLLYRSAFEGQGDTAAHWLAERFDRHGWSRAWKNGIYPYHHYHSTAHEVLGIYGGNGTVQLGGEHGSAVELAAGDILILPAGTAHRCIRDEQLQVVGAYADGREWDINRGEPEERPRADENIQSLPLPQLDPMHGRQGLPNIWRAE